MPGPIQHARICQRKIPVDDQLPEALHPVLRRILLARGVGDAAALELSIKRLAVPDSMKGLGQGASLLADAIVAGEHIRVVGDFDADGATGTALAIRGLTAMGAQNIDFRVPDRFGFGYGLSRELVESFAPGMPDLIVTVDSGIACISGAARARELGARVVITDHHLPGKTLPVADAIINPNQAGDEFPSKALAGVGVVFYLLSAVRTELAKRAWFDRSRPRPRLDHLLDLVALGTVADLVPLDYNNRILVSQGLARIRAGKACEGIMALLRAGNRDYRNVVAADLGFVVGPRLNAAGRLEDMGTGIACLLSDDATHAAAIAAELDTLNRERRSLQEDMQQQASSMLDRMSPQEVEQRMSLCIHDPGWHQGIVGLVASRIKDRFHRPVVAFAPSEPGSSLLKGSARSISGLHIRDVLAHVDASRPGLIRQFGGHAMAAGLSLDADRLDSFEQALEESVNLFLDGELPSATIWTDGELPGENLNLEFANALRGIGPWGQRFPEPLFEGGFEILDQRIVGEAHLKMLLRPWDGPEPVDAIAFRTLPEDLPGGRSVRMVYRLDVNHFRGESTCQLVVEGFVGQG